jgi:hypothetical protein
MIDDLSWYLCTCLLIEYAAEASPVCLRRDLRRFALKYASAGLDTPDQEAFQSCSTWTRRPFFEAFFYIKTKIHVVPAEVNLAMFVTKEPTYS